jgi:NAD dependent epimerase/dehydratase family enzyme
MADTVLHGRRALPKRLRELGFEWDFPELEGALRDLLG